ncbi:ABC-2 family transporter protein [Candidatus Microgenomates bacterium]|nr:ABC-2 family transporter protein [Candidatus Microgenomates bacterium]
MKKYWQVFKNTWDEYFTYRLNFIMWRVRTVLQLLAIYFLWWSIFQNQKGEIFGYSQSLLLTYILGTAILRAIVFSSRTISVGDEINQGNLTNFLLKPISYLKYWFTRDLADKSMNISFAIFELTLIIILLRPPLFLQTDIINLLFFIASVILAIVLYFYINFLLGLVAFWSPEVWAPRFIFFILVEFFAGGLFPLDILPEFLYRIVKFLPLSYLEFFPLKIYLGQLNNFQVIQSLFISFIWILIFSQIVNRVWEKGLRVYSAEGK